MHHSDENEISPYMITACSNIQVMRIKETIIKDQMSRWILLTSSNKNV